MASISQSSTYLSSQAKKKILSVSCNGPKKNRVGRSVKKKIALFL